MQPSLEIIPCVTAFLFSDFIFLKFQQSKLSTLNISSPSNLTANFLTIALPTLLADILFLSLVESKLMLKERLTIPTMMMSSLPKLGNLTNSNWFWSISLGLCVTIIFCLVPFILRAILRECSGLSLFPYSILKYEEKNFNFQSHI